MHERIDLTVVLVTHDSADVVGGPLAGLPDGCAGLRRQLVVPDLRRKVAAEMPHATLLLAELSVLGEGGV